MTLEREFTEHHDLLFGLAYRMLGTRSEAEDVLQDAFVRVHEMPADEIRSPRALFSTVVTRLCLDRLKSSAARRTEYVGPWLPEPIATTDDLSPSPADRIGRAESVTMAFLLLLETLSPLERAVFLLRDVFDYELSEIAETLSRSESTCRQLLHRAREHVREKRPRFAPDPEERARIVMEFLRASALGDVARFEKILARTVSLTSDGGGKVAAARNVIEGPDAVSRFILGLAKRSPAGATYDLAVLNASPAIVVRVGDRIESAIVLEIADGLIQDIRIVRNPDKLAAL
jgi:RNA polymerase sigma-70 factor, ECF subfamily